MKKIYVWMLMLFSIVVASAQTTLISPTGDGGFENGSTFAANGWTVVNPATDQWALGSVGTTLPAASGTSCAYVSANGGTAWTYSQLSVFNHMYRDVTIPAGENKVTLSFKWRAGGEGTTTSDWDNLKVFFGPTTITPTSTTAVTGATQLSGAGAVSGMYKLNSATWNNETITFIGTPGTTIRLFFQWKSDGSDIVNPPAALDDISLVSSVPGNFISIATGNFGDATTWDANAVPTIADNITVSTGHTVTINSLNQGSNNLIVSGTLTYAATPTAFNVNGNLTVNTGGLFNVFNSTTGKSLIVSGDIINNGRIDLSVSSSTTSTTTQGNLTLNGSVAQTISGTGVFGGTVSTTDATNRVAVIRYLTCANTSSVTPNIIWNVNNIKLMNGINITGARISLGSNKLILGNFAVASATITMPIGTGFLPGGVFARWWTTTATGTAITAGTDPTNSTSRYPFITSTGTQRAMYISRTGTTTGNVAGELAVQYTDATTSTTGLSILDGTYNITDRFDGKWTVSSDASYVANGTHIVAIVADNALFTTTQNSRVMLATAPMGGTHQNGTLTPGAQRAGLTTANLLGDLYLGINNSEIPHVSITSGNWNNATTWNKGTVPTCTDAVTVAPGHNVTVNSTANNTRSLSIAAGGTLTMSSGELTVGCSDNNNIFVNNGTLTVSGGVLNVNGSFTHNAGSTFNHSNGEVVVDGNSGVLATSVSGSIVQLNSQFINWTGGLLAIVDPHFGTGNSITYTNSIAHVNVTSGHTLQFGNSLSTTAGGTNGFRINSWASSFRITFNNVVLDALAGTNRFVSSTYDLGINGDLTINAASELRFTTVLHLAKNLVNNGKLVSNSTVTFGNFLNGSSSASSNAQTISGTGLFENNATTASITGNFVNLTVNNSNASGVTFSLPVSVTGTLNLISGFLNTTDTNILTVGTATAVGTVTGGSATAYVKGPIKRFFGNANSTFQLFPVGNATYKPIWLNPSTTAVGSSMKAAAFDTNTGTANPGIASLSSTTRWEAPVVDGSAGITNVRVRISGPTLTNTNIVVQAPTAAGEYNSAFGPLTTNFVTGTPPAPNTLESQNALVTASYTGFLSFATLNACSGTPTPGNTVATATTICNGQSVNLAIQNIPTTTGNTYQWQSSADGTTYTDITTATATSFTVTPTTATYYRCLVTCANGGASATSTAVQITFTNNVDATTPGTRCGEGTVSLSATTTSGTLKWYATASGGASLGTGTSFTTPSIAATTSYFVGAESFSSGSATLGAGATNSSSTAASFFPGAWGGTKTQYIIKASELTAAGIGAGNITSIGFEPTTSGQTYQGFFVNIGQTTAEVATSTFINSGLTFVYSGTETDNGFTPVANTVNNLTFGTGTGTSPTFNWDGTSNIVVSISWSRVPATNTATGSTMKVDNVGFTSTVYHQADNLTPAEMLAITASTAFTPTSSNRPRFHFNGQVVCSSPRVAVVATVTTPPAFTLSSNATSICNGSTSTPITIATGAADYNTYVWSPASGVSGNATTGWTFNPTVSTLFTLTASQSTGNLCATTTTVNVTVTPIPSAMTISPATESVCANSITTLSVAGGTMSNIDIINENFNAPTNSWTRINNTTNAADTTIPAWTLRPSGFVQSSTTFNSNDVSQFYLSNSDAAGTGNVTDTSLISPSFSTVNFTDANLTFWHFYQHWSSGNSIAKVQYSIDNGTTWVDMQSYTATTGTASAFINVNLPLPAAAINQANVKIKFQYNVVWGYYWAIDNVKVSGTQNTSTVWSPTTNLFTDAAATIAYTGTAATTVYHKSATALLSTTYTVTATAANGCTNSASKNITVNAQPTLVIVPPAAVCTPGTVNLTDASVTTGSDTGLTFTYFTDAAATVVYSTPTTATAGTYYIKATNANGCSTVASVVVTVNPLPTVVTVAPAAVCSPATVDLTAAAITTGSSTGLTFTYFTDAAATVVYSTPTTATAGTYYIKGTNANGCSSIASVVVTVTVTAAPTGAATQSFCTSANITQLVATGTGIKWYDAATGGNFLPTISAIGLTNGTTYYATQTLNGCESTSRLAVTVTITPLATPAFTQVAPICSGATLAALPTTSSNSITGTWSPALNNTATTTYTFTPDAGLCATTTTMTIVVNANVNPTFTQVAPICSGATLAALPTTSNNSITGTWSPALNNTATTTYTFTPDAGLCATTTTMTIVVNPLASTPTGNATQAFSVVNLNDATINSLIVSPTSVVWYPTLADAQAGTNPIAAGTVITNGSTYYAVNVAGGCPSTPFAVTVTVTLGSKEFDVKGFVAYPNPVIDVLNMSYSSEMTNINIHNMLGQVVITRNINSKEAQIDLSNLEAGTYFVNVTANDTVHTFKVIKK